ncbi:MAG TPA: glycosyltransferase [Acidimicrobiales bacterium]|nr:glycosyltransferase [Acidimicrobiales bacterium]|tara:strand:+ start:2674 stop:3888 length:1215 start_codon:yes stop_codon:yes gene_type:complete
MNRLAVLSLHTSPLVQPGSGDSGGMNVYVRELISALARLGRESTVFVRRTDLTTPEVVDVEPGFRVVHVTAGALDLSKEELPEVVDQFADQVGKWIRKHGGFDGLLANYWLSGLAGHRLKHELDLPLTTVFHTLARVKAETGDIEPQRRMEAETTVARCSDIILANSEEEAQQLVDLYGADISRIEIVPPGVDHSLFSPGDQEEARNAIGLNGDPVLLFVGRIQPLKGVEVAIKTLASLEKYPNARLIIVGGASGPEGPSTEETIWSLVNQLELVDRVMFIPPQAHHDLCMWYRSADVLIMPSRSESFGLVALEAAACGIPAVASDVGGLRTLVDHGRTGFLVEGRSSEDFAKCSSMLFEDPIMAAEMAVAAAEKSWAFTWLATAERLRSICDSRATQALVECS